MAALNETQIIQLSALIKNIVISNFEEGKKKFSFTLIAQKKKQVDLFNKYPELDINH